MDINSNDKKIKKLKRTIYLLLVLFGISAILVVWSMYQRSETYTQNIHMKDELTQLMGEYEVIKRQNTQFQSQLTEKDSLILSNSVEIQKLINSQADYRKIRKQLDMLRTITQDYVRRIDSLIVVNEELALENEEFRKEISVEREKNKELRKVKTELDQKVTQASTLKAYNLKAFALRVKGKTETETDKAIRADKIAVEFTLSENKIVSEGSRSIYVRIARPDGAIILAGEGDEYAFEINGAFLQYTIKQDIYYTTAAQNIRMSCLKRDAKAPTMAGVYTVIVYMDNQEIGQTFFDLK